MGTAWLDHDATGALDAVTRYATTVRHDPRLQRVIGRQEQFASILSRAAERWGTTGAAPPAPASRRAAQELVAVALVQPLLAQLRDADAAAEPFAMTPAQRQFRALLDASVALEIVRAARWPLVDRVAEQLAGRTAHATPSQPAPTGSEPTP